MATPAHVRRRAIGIVLSLVLAFTVAAGASRHPSASLPAQLSDRAFWELSQALSEPAGTFRSENLVSNEHTFQYVIPQLIRQVRPGGVYLGVAPDQNFSYIIATQPRMAFILDIRRGNLLQHLLYKALIERSTDRADFVSRLFSRPRPPGLSETSTAAEIFAAFATVPSNEAMYKRSVVELGDWLTRRHGFPLSPDDLENMEAIYFQFYWEGPNLRYSSLPGTQGPPRGIGFPTYAELMVATDWAGRTRSYLADEAHFKDIKSFQEKNLLVPVVGNFAGPTALKNIGRYVRDHESVITAFYVSNVEQYLYQDGLFDAFARNVASLPIDGQSTFIRSVWSRFGFTGPMLGPDSRGTSLYPIRDFVRDFQDGRLGSYYDLNRLSR